MELAAQSYL